MKKNPTKVKQRVKLKDVGLVATAHNPVMSSPLECTGTVTEVRGSTIFVKWDNDHDNRYLSENLLIADFPLKFLPMFIKFDKNNPNITFKELEHYKLIEKERLEHEARKKIREEERNKLDNSLSEQFYDYIRTSRY